MLLKTLELQGFKTFPDKTKLSFDKGITAVVGPNGSGKSNISDAIRWVLGEQSTKTLRCSKMEDVIFSGTTFRKSQGFAQVTLTIDNSDRRLTFDSDEISITRRFYRSGESEYLLNNVSVRLRDIHELLMDTGLGRDGYSIIGQGKIDSIVASKSEDRREIFEEAAGISKYRYRKFEAEKKLKQANENLLRLRDILSELESRVEPLKEQASKAKSYLTYMDEKKSLEIGIWLNTLEKSNKILREYEDKISIFKGQSDEIQDCLDNTSKSIEEIFLKNSKHTANVDEIRRRISSIEEESLNKLSRASILENDMLHNNENIKRINEEISIISLSENDLNHDIESKKILIESKKSDIENDNILLDECVKNLNSFKDTFDKFSSLIDDLTKELSKLTMEVSNHKVLSLSYNSSIQEAEEKINLTDKNILEKQKYLDEISTESLKYKKHYEEILNKILEMENSLKGYELKLSSKREKAELLKKQVDKLNLDEQECIRKIKLLEDLERNLEGFANSVKFVMQESKNGMLPGIHGPISKLIKVKDEYAAAIEVALGSSVQNIVVNNENDAKQAIALLKQKNCGRATFLPISVINGNEISIDHIDNIDGVIGVASTLCNCNEKYKLILKSLLGRIIVVDNLNTATNVAKKLNYRYRIVTLDGQVINTGGSLTGGSLSKNSGLISRSSKIEKEKLLYESLKAKSLEAAEQYKKSKEEVSSQEALFLGVNADISNLKEDKVRIESEYKRLNGEIDSVTKSLNDLKKEHSYFSEKLKSLNEQKIESSSKIQILSSKIKETEDKIACITGNRDEIILKREALSSKIQDIKLNILALNKDVESISIEISSIESRKVDQQDKLNCLKDQINNLKINNKKLDLEINSLKAESFELKQTSKNLEEDIQSLNQERQVLERKSVELRQVEKEKTQEKENILRELTKLEEKKNTQKKEYDLIISKLWEEYELTRREAEQTVNKIDDIKEAYKTLNELKLKIKNLGSINVGAIEEYDEVKKRYDFMSHQMNDVEKSKDELSKLISDLSHQMKDLFTRRFKQINLNFSDTFRELFGGGKASLSLTDEDDILNCGIDISVQPPGKIALHLDALSGGEKALVAISLYFAIMKVNPAPFCILDEIEAALDDVNVDRYASYLRKMSENTQFIVVTHRRGTMEEADVLYGVTMQDEGISKLLLGISRDVTAAV